jgi:hypothetical protein
MADNVSFKDHFEDFVNATEEERERAEARRDYRDLKQWSEKEAAALEARGQAPIVFDQFGKKVDAICGLEIQRRSDPKALPITPKHEKASDAITDALRYVEARTNFDEIASEVFEDKIVEGYGGVIIEVSEKKDDFVIEINQLYWDRIYFDPHSRRKDFKDAKYFGITLWMDKSDAEDRFKASKDKIEALMVSKGMDGTTFEDRPTNWIDRKRKRVRVNEEYFLQGGKWMQVFYTGDTVLIEPKESPYLDEMGDPTCPIELQSDFTDRDNNRYGYTERLKDPQDEINHRRSKALFMLSSKSIIAERGAFADVPREVVLDEMRKGMSFLEKTPGTEVIVDQQQELGQSQLAFYQDAQNAMDSVGINPELTGGSENAISGRAFLARQQGGMVELARVFSRHSEWKRRVYRQIWSRIKQFWTEEKWVRVTDEEDAMKFVGLNTPITRIEKMMEEQSGKDISDIRQQAGDQVDQFIEQALARDPSLGQVVETRNNVAEIDMDITLEEAPDTATIQQEQFDTLAQLAGSRADPQMFDILLQLSTLKGKDKIMDKFKGDPQAQQAQQEQQAQAMQVQQAQIMADIEKTNSETQKNLADVQLKASQTKDEEASAMERIANVSMVGLPTK